MDLLQRGPCEQVLELACATGTWTQVLLAIGQQITAIDAAPEMLEIAQQKPGNARVHYQQADLFQWEPEQEYHLVFFANWLSHVPPEELDTVLFRVSRAVRPGGYVAIIDQYAPTPEDRRIMKKGEGGNIYAQRPLRSILDRSGRGQFHGRIAAKGPISKRSIAVHSDTGLANMPDRRY